MIVLIVSTKLDLRVSAKFWNSDWNQVQKSFLKILNFAHGKNQVITQALSQIRVSPSTAHIPNTMRPESPNWILSNWNVNWTRSDHLCGLKCKQVPLEVLSRAVNTTGFWELPTKMVSVFVAATGGNIYRHFQVMFTWLLIFIKKCKVSPNVSLCLCSSSPIRSRVELAT